MIEIIKSGTTIDFVSKMKHVAIFSIVIMFIAIYGIMNNMKYGVDFRGGVEVQVQFDKQTSMDDIRDSLDKSGFKGAVVQTIGEVSENNVLIKVQADETQLNQVSENIKKSLMESFSGTTVEVEKIDIVGPKAGAELRMSAIKAMLWAILAIMVYVAIRFDFKFAPGVIISLVHDVVIVAGLVAFSPFEFTLSTVAALLAIIGYSVNDTVVVYDRIREAEEKDPTLSLAHNINLAINDTLSRTILTSVGVFFVSITMFLTGDGDLKNFFFTLIVGVAFGTYSSIFVAAASTIAFDRFFKKEVKKSENNPVHV